MRSSEIQAGAVRSSESSMRASCSPTSRPAPACARRSARPVDNGESGYRACRQCSEALTDCSNLMAVHLPAGRWLVQAKLVVFGVFPNLGNTCGLVQSDTTVIDRVCTSVSARKARPASKSR